MHRSGGNKNIQIIYDNSKQNKQKKNLGWRTINTSNGFRHVGTPVLVWHSTIIGIKNEAGIHGAHVHIKGYVYIIFHDIGYVKHVLCTYLTLYHRVITELRVYQVMYNTKQ